MRELKYSKVYFNNPYKVYKSGDILKGHVEINLYSPKTVQNVCITISGAASVSWSQSESTTDSNGNLTSNSVSYTNSEQYFKERIYVVGNTIDLPAGQHIFPFQYILPPNLPSSYGNKTSVGKIIYKVKITLNRPWKINKYMEEIFFVETAIHHHPWIKQPQMMKMDKQFGVIFKSKPLTVTVKTPQQGFQPGRNIPLRIEVNNKSNITVKYISVKLREMSKFHATTKTRTDMKTISKNHITNQIPANKCLFFNHFLTVPPDLVPIDLTNCSIIDVLYVIQVELHTAGLTKNLVGSMPMIPIKL